MRVAASLSHPNVVKVFDAIEHEGAVLLVMEYVDGPSLARRMGDGPLPGKEALAILRPLAGAVDHLHAQGVIHRDVKPANVMLDHEDRVKLTDLGIASAAQATGSRRPARSSGRRPTWRRRCSTATARPTPPTSTPSRRSRSRC